MANIYDACKHIGAEDSYNCFVYNKEKKIVYVVELCLKTEDIKNFLNYIGEDISLHTIGVVTMDEKGKEYFSLAEYRLKGNRITTNKNPAPVNSNSLEELIRAKNLSEKAAESTRKNILIPALEQITKKKNQCDEECDYCDDDDDY